MITSLPGLFFNFRRFILLVQTKEISISYSSSTSILISWRWVGLDLILMIKDIYISSNLYPLTKFISNSRSTELKDIFPSGPILDIRGMGVIFGGNVFKKGAFCLVAAHNQMSFLTISNVNIFFENQGTRLGVIITPNKGLEQNLSMRHLSNHQGCLCQQFLFWHS